MSPSNRSLGRASSVPLDNALAGGISGLSLGGLGQPLSRGFTPLARGTPIPSDFVEMEHADQFRAWDPSAKDAQVERAVKIRACLDLTTVLLTIPLTYRGILSERFSAFMVNLDRAEALRRTTAKLEGLLSRGEFPHSYNSIKMPTLQFQRGVKDLWETNWNVPIQSALKDLKTSCLQAELSFKRAELLKVQESIAERVVIQDCFEACKGVMLKRSQAPGMVTVTVDNDSVMTFKETDFVPLKGEFQALQVDLPHYIRKVLDLKLDLIERAVSSLAKKDAKKQEKRDLDVEMQDVAHPQSPETLMTINQLVQRQVASALKNIKSKAPSPNKVGEVGEVYFKLSDVTPLETRFPESWFLEEDGPPTSCPSPERSGTTAATRGQEEEDLSVAQGEAHRQEQSAGSWRRQQAAQAWQRRERQRQTQEAVGTLLRKPWTFGDSNSYPDEILLLPPSIQFSVLLSRAPSQALEANKFRSSVHVQAGVVVPVQIQHDLSASLKFMFRQRIDGGKILKAYTDLVRRIRWRWYFLDKVGEDYDPDYDVTKEEKKNKQPPRVHAHIERGLAAGQEYVDQVIRSIPELKRNADSLVSVNTKRAQQFMVSNDLIVTSTDKNLGVAVFKREWIYSEATKLFGNTDDYQWVAADGAKSFLCEIAKEVDELCDIHLKDEEQLSKFMSCNVPLEEDRNEWSSWAKYVPEAYAIPKIHKNPWKGRPICPGYSLPQNPASKVLSKITRPFIDNLPWVIQGSKDFVQKLSKIKIPPGKKCWIVSADVVNFYPSVDANKLVEIMNEFADEVLVTNEIAQGKLPLSRRENRLDYYERLFKLALANPVMTFLDKILIQLKGLPMGAAGSPDAANMYGAYYEREWIQEVFTNPEILFYGRYLDDIISFVLAETADEAAAKVSFMKLGGVKLLWEPPSNTVNFLDLSVSILEDGSIHHVPFVKAMSHRERIPWSSAHPLDVKKGTFSSEISRLATLCSAKADYLNQCQEAVNLYIGRGYPPKLVTSWLKNQKEKRWDNRLITLSEENPAQTLFTLKTEFNDAWKYFNVAELESKIKAQWEGGLDRSTVLGKRTRQPVKSVRLVTPRTGVVGQTRISFVRDDDSETTIEPVLGRVTRSNAGLLSQQEVRKWTGQWIDSGRFLVSRRKTTQLWDLTRQWNKQIWKEVLEENELKCPFKPSYGWLFSPEEEEHR